MTAYYPATVLHSEDAMSFFGLFVSFPLELSGAVSIQSRCWSTGGLEPLLYLACLTKGRLATQGYSEIPSGITD